MQVFSGRGSPRLILLLCALALVLAGCAHHGATVSAAGTGGGGSHGGSGTRTDVFSAYDSTGGLAVKVADVASGRCWTSSVAAPSPNAFRCFAGNTILDPCFARPDERSPTQVACLTAPWSEAEVLTLTAPLPAAETGTAHRAWAFQLNNGARCVASAGTVPEVQGINLSYRCSDGNAAALRDVSADTVKAYYGDPKSQTVQTVTVTRIWHA